MLKGLTRFSLVAAALLSVGVLAGCGQEAPDKRSESAEQNTREEPRDAASQPAEATPPEVAQEPPADKSAPRNDEWLDAAGRGRAPAAPGPAEQPGDGLGQSGTGQGGGGSGEASIGARPQEPASPPPDDVVAEAPPEESVGEPEAGSDAGAEPPPSPPPPPPERAAEEPAGGAPPPVAESPKADGEAKEASRGLAAAAGDDKFDVVPVYYGTDRAVEADPQRLKYGSERGHKLQLGRALVTVPTAHKVPAIERPWVIEIPYFKVKIYEEKEDPAKHFTLQEMRALTREEMLALVKERLGKSVNFKDHAIVFVHGFNTAFDYALYRMAQIAYDLKFDGAPFVYSWPSGGNVASYTYDRGSAEQAEPHLAEFLKLVVEESGAKSISLIAHSMGNEVLLRVLERMRPKAPEGVVISQVILAAPDVDRDKFQNIAREITDFASGVTLYAASNDRALRYSQSFWGGIPRAGDVPATGPLVVPGVDTIDVSAVSTDSLGLNHSGYAENNALLNDIKLLIQTGERPPDKRIPILQPMKTQAGGAYWRYPPAP